MKRYAIRFSLKRNQFEKIVDAAKGSGLTPAAFARMHVLNAARKWKTVPIVEEFGKYCPKCFVVIKGCKNPKEHKDAWTEQEA